MAFRFRFQTLLKVRRIQEDLARQAFAQAQKHLMALEAANEQVRAQKEIVTAELMVGLSKGMPALEVGRVYNYMYHLDETLDRIRDAMEKARLSLEQRRLELIRAKKSHRIMERLKEIHLERHSREENKKDMDFIDEIAVRNAGGER